MTVAEASNAQAPPARHAVARRAGERLRNARQLAGLSQRELAHAAYLSHARMVSGYEAESLCPPLRTRVLICQALAARGVDLQPAAIWDAER